MRNARPMAALVVLGCLTYVQLVGAQELARPGGPLVCHKEVCPVPVAPCWVRESDKCVHGGGPPRCPAIIPAPTGTPCNDGNVCTGTPPIPSLAGDFCSAGFCTAGALLTCSSSTDTCSPISGCATLCDAAGCVVLGTGTGDPKLTVPPGALSASVRISIVDRGGDPNDPSVYHVYDLGPSGTNFSPAATIDLPAPAVGSTDTVVIEVSDDGVTWTEVASTLSGGRVTGPITHFSKCRSRVRSIPLTQDLIMLDMVQWPDVQSPLNLTGIAFPGCNPTDYHGICFSFFNQSTTTTVTTAQVRIAGWQCYSATNDITNTPPGDHCDFAGLLIPCDPVDVTLTLPAGGIPPLGTGSADINLVGVISSCGGSSFVGVDVLFREPKAGDTSAGIRSARDGPLVCTNPSCNTRTLFQGIYPTQKFSPTGKLIQDFLNDWRE